MSAFRDTIDVHCHIFNARDLPIHQFVTRVFLVDHQVEAALADPLIAFVSLIMDSAAPSAMKEITEIGRIAAGAATPLEYVQTSEQKRQIVQGALERFLRPGNTVALTRSGVEIKLDLDRRQAFVDELRVRTQQKAKKALGFSLDDLGNLAGQLILGGETLLQAVPWALIFTNYRFEILRQLVELSPEAEREVAFYVPALVDFNKWLMQPDDVEVTSMAEQAAVMCEISAMPGRSYAMHGYVAFDPWRQAVAQNKGVPYETVTKAVNEQGFIGVKLYPPMGFRPIGNSELNEPDFPAELVSELRPIATSSGKTCGELLDEALIVLYDWCVAEDVPIMAHCGCSNYARDGFGERASPLYWKRVLDYKDSYRNLRLNLGHIGGLTEFADDKPGKDWMPALIAMLNSSQYPNLYADLAYDSLALERDEKETEENNTVIKYLKGHLQGTNAVYGIMYGSDWIMLGLEPSNDRYYGALKECFRDILGSDDLLNRFMKKNAADYLGLSNQNGAKSNIRKRLDAFYQKRGLDTAVLDRLVS